MAWDEIFGLIYIGHFTGLTITKIIEF